MRILCNKVKMEHLWRKLLRVLFVWCLVKAESGTKAEFVAKTAHIQDMIAEDTGSEIMDLLNQAKADYAASK